MQISSLFSTFQSINSQKELTAVEASEVSNSAEVRDPTEGAGRINRWAINLLRKNIFGDQPDRVNDAPKESLNGRAPTRGRTAENQLLFFGSDSDGTR